MRSLIFYCPEPVDTVRRKIAAEVSDCSSMCIWINCKKCKTFRGEARDHGFKLVTITNIFLNQARPLPIAFCHLAPTAEGTEVILQFRPPIVFLIIACLLTLLSSWMLFRGEQRFSFGVHWTLVLVTFFGINAYAWSMTFIMTHQGETEYTKALKQIIQLEPVLP